MAKVTDLVAAATQMLHEQKFCDDFIRKYVAIWRKLQIYAQKYRIDEFSWDLARTFLQEEYNIDIEGDDIYSADCKKVHYTTVRPLLYLLLIQNDAGLIRTTKIGVISFFSVIALMPNLAATAQSGSRFNSLTREEGSGYDCKNALSLRLAATASASHLKCPAPAFISK